MKQILFGLWLAITLASAWYLGPLVYNEWDCWERWRNVVGNLVLKMRDCERLPSNTGNYDDACDPEYNSARRMQKACKRELARNTRILVGIPIGTAILFGVGYWLTSRASPDTSR